MSSLYQNPFYLLGVSVRDDRQTILQQAEARALELEPDVCQQARADLTHPRRRLAAEISWLPGLSPRAAAQALERVKSSPESLLDERNMPALARFNLLIGAIGELGSASLRKNLDSFVLEAGNTFAEAEPYQVINDINADRIASGFAEITDHPAIQEALREQLRQAKNVIEAALDRLPPSELLDVLTSIVDRSTENGERPASDLVDVLVDSYSLRVTPLLEQEGKLIHSLVDSVVAAAEIGEPAVKLELQKLDRVTRNWDRFAQPIQLSAKARGLEHAPSEKLARTLRNLGVDLFNNHNMLESARFMTDMLADVFAELPEVVEQVGIDHVALAKFEASAANLDEWAKYITFEADVGALFKDKLKISPDGIYWKGKTYTLDSITAVRWGGVRRSTNGIPTGTEYTIAFAAGDRVVQLDLRREKTYEGFVAALWRAVGSRLVANMGRQMKAGATVQIGNIRMREGTLILNRSRLLRKPEPVECPLSSITMSSHDGHFIVRSTLEPKAVGSASYKDHWNTFVLEHILSSGAG